MADDLIPVGPDFVDDRLWFETPQTSVATAALWRTLAAARGEPMWMPLVALVGPSGVGTSALAARFVRAAQRSVACDVMAERGEEVGSLLRGSAAWARRMTRDFGSCLGHCHPARLMHEAELAQIIGGATDIQPATIVPMSRAAHKNDLTMYAPAVWRSPGNVNNDPIRRTVMVFVEGADRLLALSPTQRRTAIDRMVDYESVIGHRVMRVFVGSPALADALAEIGSTQVIALDPLPLDEAFASVARMIFGPSSTREDLAELHRTTHGLVGQMLHLAALRGLKPPYAVRDEEIRRLPAPDATRR